MSAPAQKFPFDFKREVLDPAACRSKLPSIQDDVWVYRYSYQTSPGASNSVLSIATLGEPNSGKLSLGGFRIVPAARAAIRGFDCDNEAIGLACGMEEKVSWSRLMHVGGPLASERIQSIVGGKCVLLPSSGARVGESHDKETLLAAAHCLNDMERISGVHITTGQDLGHGILSDGSTHSLQYLHEHFRGSILSDTSQPTAEGNFQVLKGMLKGLGITISAAQVGLIGCGNIGRFMLQRLQDEGAQVTVLESSAATREELQARGVRVMAPDEKSNFLSLPLDAIAVNASGGSLDPEAVQCICKNSRLSVLCGSENLAMPDPSQVTYLMKARKVYCPTELGGMMGYLTAVEEYLCQESGRVFDINEMFLAAQKLYDGGLRAAQTVVENNFEISFEEAVKVVYR